MRTLLERLEELSKTDICFPYETKFGITIDNFPVFCKECKRKVFETKGKGKIREFANSVEIEIATACEKCRKIMIVGPIRIHEDCSIVVFNGKEWVRSKESFWDKFKKIIRSMFK